MRLGWDTGSDAPARVSRLASGGCRIGGGFAVGRKFLVSVSAPSTCQPSRIGSPDQPHSGAGVTVVSEIVVCFVWSTSRQSSRSWISVQRSFQQSTCELTPPSSRRSVVGKQCVA